MPCSTATMVWTVVVVVISLGVVSLPGIAAVTANSGPLSVTVDVHDYSVSLKLGPHGIARTFPPSVFLDGKLQTLANSGPSGLQCRVAPATSRGTDIFGTYEVRLVSGAACSADDPL